MKYRVFPLTGPSIDIEASHLQVGDNYLLWADKEQTMLAASFSRTAVFGVVQVESLDEKSRESTGAF